MAAVESFPSPVCLSSIAPSTPDSVSLSMRRRRGCCWRNLLLVILFMIVMRRGDPLGRPLSLSLHLELLGLARHYSH